MDFVALVTRNREEEAPFPCYEIAILGVDRKCYIVVQFFYYNLLIRRSWHPIPRQERPNPLCLFLEPCPL